MFNLALYIFKILISRVCRVLVCHENVSSQMANEIDYWIYVNFMISFVRLSLLPDVSVVYFTRSYERRGKDH